MFRRIAIILGALLSMFLAVPSASAAPQDDLLAMVNDVRAQNGLSALTRMDGLSSVAQAWSQHMADAGTMSHNPDVASQIPAGWQSWAENVGYASGTDNNARTVFDAWMKSDGHRANILNPNFTHIGIGTVVDGAGTLWATQNFGQYPPGGGSSTPPVTAPTPTPVPTPVAEPVTSPEPVSVPEPVVVEQPEPSTAPAPVEEPVVTEPTPEQTTMAVPEPTSTTVDKTLELTDKQPVIADKPNDLLKKWWFWLLVVIAVGSTVGAIAVYQQDKKRQRARANRPRTDSLNG